MIFSLHMPLLKFVEIQKNQKIVASARIIGKGISAECLCYNKQRKNNAVRRTYDFRFHKDIYKE